MIISLVIMLVNNYANSIDFYYSNYRKMFHVEHTLELSGTQHFTQSMINFTFLFVEIYNNQLNFKNIDGAKTHIA